jgi:ABC-type antimicrobial peptide transport system permease subunit
VVLSHYFLDLYNSALADSNNLPKFSPSAIIGRHMELLLGESTIHPVDENVPPDQRKTRMVKAYIAGLTTNPDLLGLLAPLEVVEAFNEWYGVPDKKYRALHVEVESNEAVENIKPALAGLGLAMRDRMAPWRKALVMVRLVGVAFVALGILVFALALAYLASAITWMLSERHRELALFRALGASPRQIMSLLATEIGVTASVGIGLGLGVAMGGLGYVNMVYLAWRGERVFLPETLFAVPWWWVAILGLFCWLVAMILSLSQVAFSQRIAIATALTKGD